MKTVLGEAVKQYCWQHNITTRDLAADWECSHTTVSRLLNGKEVSMATFIKALEWLTTDLSKLEEDDLRLATPKAGDDDRANN